VTLGFGRLRTREELAANEAIAVGKRTAPEFPAGFAEPKELVDAVLRAERIVAEASEQARQIVERARAEVRELEARLTFEARAEANAAVAAQTLALAAREARADELGLERAIGLARILAERLLGEALALDPSRVVALAETALAEARGARRVVLVANPEDVPALERAREYGNLTQVVRIVPSSERARGALRVESEIGVLDAALAPQLDRLTERLRESSFR
jgi:flagellar assembly protein FliH/type III secretion protein L